jgi:MarR family transcriptional regulator, organic hydroperoxide resistance regulator
MKDQFLNNQPFTFKAVIIQQNPDQEAIQLGDKQQLIDSIFSLHEKMNRLSLIYPVEKWMKLDLTIDQLKVLILIQSYGKISFKDIAQALGSTRGNITGIVNRLIQKGLVTRQPDPEDRRVQYLKLTEKAQKLLNNIRQRIITEQGNILSGLSLENLEALETGLSAFVKSTESYLLNRQNRI